MAWGLLGVSWGPPGGLGLLGVLEPLGRVLGLPWELQGVPEALGGLEEAPGGSGGRKYRETYCIVMCFVVPGGYRSGGN